MGIKKSSKQYETNFFSGFYNQVLDNKNKVKTCKDNNNKAEHLNTDNNIEINILPFMCEAFSTNKIIYKNIDEIYNKDRVRYYEAAKSSYYYNHLICDEGSIEQEYYYKKMLGIIIEATKDEYVTELVINKLFKKGWEYAFNYMQNNEIIDVEKYMFRFIKKNKGLDNITDDYLNSNVLVLICLAQMFNKDIKENEFFKTILFDYQRRKEMMTVKKDLLNIENRPKEIKDKIRTLENKIRNSGIITFKPLDLKASSINLNNINSDIEKMSILDKYLLCYEYIYDYEYISLVSIVGNDYLNSKEVRELIFIYVNIFKKEDNIETIIRFLYPAIQIRYLCKEYKKAKKHFFNNFNEELNIIIKKKDMEIKETEKTKNHLINENKRLSERVTELERDNKRLKEEIEKDTINKKELYSLREFVFKLDEKENYEEIEDINYRYLKEKKGIIIGGHNNWQRKMKEFLPYFKFVSMDNINFDVNIFNDKEPVFIYTNYLSHGLYYKVINEIRKRDIPLYYLSYNVNEKIVLKKIHGDIIND